MESTRAQEAAIRKQTNEELDTFRQQQEKAERAARAEEGRNEDIQPDVQWHAGPRKKRKVVEKEGVKGVKIRRVSSTAGEGALDTQPQSSSKSSQATKLIPASPESQLIEGKGAELHSARSAQRDLSSHAPVTTPPPTVALGLGAYSSEEE